MNYSYNSECKMMQVTVPGDLLSTNADQFRDTAHAMAEAYPLSYPEWNRVEVNLENAHMVDSAGLNALVGLLKRLKSEGRQMVIRVADPHVHRVLVFTRLDKQAEIIRNLRQRLQPL